MGVNPPGSLSSNPSLGTPNQRRQMASPYKQPPRTERGWRVVQCGSGRARQASLSPPSLHHHPTQPILSTSFLLPETLLSYRLALLLSGGLTSLSPLPRFLFSHLLLSTCPSLPSNAFPWPHMVLQPLSCLNAQLTARFHFLAILCFTSYGTLAASQSPTNFSAHGDLAFA